MIANDIKKGMRIKLRQNGWFATMADNKKGITRLCDVEGIYREFGSVYAYDILQVLNPETGNWEGVTLSPAQEKQRTRIKTMGL